MRAFISYSHQDKEQLDRLHIHLKNLIRDGQLTAWYDRDILAGSELDVEIKCELESADLFLLLVSPDFIASDYCVNTELARAVERHDKGTAVVVPIIIEPCDWAAMNSLRRLKALPRDAKPVTDWTNANTAFLDVVQEIRRLIERFSPAVPSETARPAIAAAVTGAQSQYRVKKSFDEIDRRDFRDRCFLEIKEYFTQAVAEITQIDGLKSRLIENNEASFSAILVNQDKANTTAHMTIKMQSGRHSFGDISFSYDLDADSKSSNGWFQVKCDEYTQYLSGQSSLHYGKNERLTSVAAAKILWTDFIGLAGVAHA